MESNHILAEICERAVAAFSKGFDYGAGRVDGLDHTGFLGSFGVLWAQPAGQGQV